MSRGCPTSALCALWFLSARLRHAAQGTKDRQRCVYASLGNANISEAKQVVAVVFCFLPLSQWQKGASRASPPCLHPLANSSWLGLWSTLPSTAHGEELKVQPSRPCRAQHSLTTLLVGCGAAVTHPHGLQRSWGPPMQGSTAPAAHMLRKTSMAGWGCGFRRPVAQTGRQGGCTGTEHFRAVTAPVTMVACGFVGHIAT